ncbi:glycosyltransferase family 87 protein [Acidobacteriota bacterium]
MSKKTIWLFIFFVVSICLFLFIFRISNDMVDFEVNLRAAQRLQMGETLYRLADEHYQFKYMPVSSFLYLPLTYLPIDLAKAIWFFLIVSSSLCLVILSNKLVLPKQHAFSLLRFLPLFVLAKYFLREIQLGQINSIVTLILIIMVWMLIQDRDRGRISTEILAGLSWGLAVALKPYALIFFPYIVIKKKWRSLAYASSFLFVAFFAPSFYFGIKGNMIVHKEWISTFFKSTPTFLTTQDNVSIIAFFSKWIGNQNLALIFTGLTILGFALLILYLILKGKNLERTPVLECSVLLICIPLVSPLGWDYNFMMSLLGLTIVLRYFQNYTFFWKIVLIINICIISLSLYDLLGRETYSLFMSWSVLTLNFIFLIGYLSFLRIKKFA